MLKVDLIVTVNIERPPRANCRGWPVKEGASGSGDS
jgi:hypothetical protein